jgi:hypothetical protein
MGREIRKVPADWQHPKKKNGNYIPLFNGNKFKKELADWIEEKKQWDKGFCSDFNGGWVKKEENELDLTYIDWNGNKPKKKDYMPEWNEKELTHIQLYENTSEGTPISPVFKENEFEKLCEYAAENCSTFTNIKATKEQWIKMLKDEFVYATEGNITFI